MIFVAPALGGDATEAEIHLRTGTVALLFRTSTGKKIEPTDAIPRAVTAAIKTARPYPAKSDASGSLAENPNQIHRPEQAIFAAGLRNKRAGRSW